MRSSNLRERVTFQTKTEASDGMGAGGTATWTDTLTGVPAAVWPLRSGELIENQKIEHQITHRVRVRYQSAMNTNMRIKWGSRYMDIISMIDIGSRNKEFEILTEELKS